jgi:hypothetical protein
MSVPRELFHVFQPLENLGVDANDGKFKIGCKCGGRFRVPVSAAGKRMKCPKCAAAIKIPIPKSAVAAKRPDVSPSTLSDGDDLLGAMADVESSAASVMPTAQDPGNPCPSCAAPVIRGAMMCTQCGHSMTGGSRPAGAKKSAGASAAAKSLGKAGAAAAVAAAAGAGRFGIGVAFSAAGAILGGVIWYAIAMSSGYEIGYVAILVGLLVPCHTLICGWHGLASISE